LGTIRGAGVELTKAQVVKSGVGLKTKGTKNVKGRKNCNEKKRALVGKGGEFLTASHNWGGISGNDGRGDMEKKPCQEMLKERG